MGNRNQLNSRTKDYDESLCFPLCAFTKKKFIERAETFFNACEENLESERLVF